MFTYLRILSMNFLRGISRIHMALYSICTTLEQPDSIESFDHKITLKTHKVHKALHSVCSVLDDPDSLESYIITSLQPITETTT